MEKAKVSLKLLIDVKTQKVIFAEGGKDFVDFLFGLLSLPLGTVIRLVADEKMMGCVGNLYRSVENMDDSFVKNQPNITKASLLKPPVPTSVPNNCVLFLLPDFVSANDSSTADQKQYYGCVYSSSHRYVSNERGTLCPACRNQMTGEVAYVSSTGEGGGEGYVKGLATYLVTDDLSVMPLSLISGVSALNKCNVQLDGLEEKVVEFGLQEGLNMLKGCLHTKAVLTYVFLICNKNDEAIQPGDAKAGQEVED